MKNAKMLKWLLILACLLAALCAFTLAANAEIVASGNCGVVDEENGLDGSQVVWSLDDEGTLIIKGTGEMKDYEFDSFQRYLYSELKESYPCPWTESFVKNVVIEKGITKIGNYSFSFCKGLQTIIITDSIKYIGHLVFQDSNSLSRVYYNGTKDQWNAIVNHSSIIPNYYDCLIKNNIVYNTDKTIVQTVFDPLIPAVSISNGVIEIAKDAFRDCINLTTVSIPNSITTIGDSAFWGCSSLEDIIIPDSVINIGVDAFSGCTAIKKITIGKTIEQFTIAEMTIPKDSLTAVNITLGATEIKDSAFSNCKELTKVLIPDSIKSIKGYAFSNCTNLTSIVIPSGVTSIDTGAFSGCIGLTSISFPNSIISIGDSAFWGCTKITNITIPESLTSIGSSAFSGCTSIERITVGKAIEHFSIAETTIPADNLTEVVIVDGAKSIKNSAFSGCKNLTSVTLPNTLTSIGANAFSDCKGLTSIVIPKSVTDIGDYAFFCSGLTSITILNGVKKIGAKAFSGSTNLTRISLPNGLTQIGESAFAGCTGLTSITIPNSVTSIGESAFANCTGLESVTISNNLKSIEDSTFSGCSGLSSITIPESVTKIGASAFSGCTELKTIIVPGGLEQIGSTAFTETAWYATQPDGIVYLNQYALGYTGELPRESTLSVAEGTKGLADGAFSGTSWLTGISIPDSVSFIGKDAFYNCYQMNRVDINSLESWCGISFGNASANPLSYAKHLFLGGKEVKQLIVPSSVSSIGDYAFYNCIGFLEIRLPDTIEKVGINAFAGCAGVRVFTAGSILGTYRFPNMPNLQTLKVRPGTKSIISASYQNSENLKIIFFPASLTKIEESAFENCKNLNDIYYEGSEEQWQKIVIENHNLAITQYAMIHYHFGMVIFGDIDGDENITSSDARLTLRASVGLENYPSNSPQYLACDVDGNGKVDAADARLILRASVGLEEPIGWECGVRFILGKYVVSAEGSLRGREYPSIDAKHVISVPSGTILTITEIHIDNRIGASIMDKYWGKTEYNSIEIWLPMAYLSKYNGRQ